MVWIVEKKIIYHILDLGFESVKLPIRVKFEFELKNNTLVHDSISKHILYNRAALEKHYPHLDALRLQKTIENKVDEEIFRYFRECGFVLPSFLPPYESTPPG